jgi:hypothetical protein
MGVQLHHGRLFLVEGSYKMRVNRMKRQGRMLE